MAQYAGFHDRAATIARRILYYIEITTIPLCASAPRE